MISLDVATRQQFRDAVNDASSRPDVRAAVANVYLALQDRIELRRPVCTSSGRCCRFDEFGHRLYVTTMEAAAFAHELRQSSVAPSIEMNAGGCPFQQAKICNVHAIRPFGCRVFFCDETSTEWQREQYESLHAELKRLHDRLQVAYFYVEWRDALGALGIGGRTLSPVQTSL